MKAFFRSTVEKMIADVDATEEKLDSLREILNKYGYGLNSVEDHQNRIDECSDIIYEVLDESEEDSKLIKFNDDKCDEMDETFYDDEDIRFYPYSLIKKDEKTITEEDDKKITELEHEINFHWGHIHSLWLQAEQ